MGLKKELALLGTVIITALSPMKSQASVEHKSDTEGIKQELVLDRVKTTKDSINQESKSLVDAIERGEKVTHGSIVIDIPKLKQMQESGKLKGFEIVFEGNKIGLKFHDDGKRGIFTKNEDPRSYMVLMPKDNFEIFLSAMLKKEIKEQDLKESVKERPENPNEWVFEDVYPEFIVIDKDGNRTQMKDRKDADKMYEKVTNFICDGNGEFFDVGKMVQGYAPELKQFGGIIGQTVLKLVGSSTWAQNRLVQNGIKPYFEERFTDLALNCGKKRDLALEEFNREKEIAVKKYQDDHDPEVLAQREKERLGNLLSIGKIKNVFQAEKKKYATSLIFSCDVVELSTNIPRIATVSISVMDGEIIEQKIGFVNTDNGYENKEKNIQPEELPQILNLIETGLSDAQKNALGKDFFDTVYKQGGIQTANNPVKLNPALIAAATKGNNK